MIDFFTWAGVVLLRDASTQDLFDRIGRAKAALNHASREARETGTAATHAALEQARLAYRHLVFVELRAVAEAQEQARLDARERHVPLVSDTRELGHGREALPTRQLRRTKTR